MRCVSGVELQAPPSKHAIVTLPQDVDTRATSLLDP